MAEKQKAALQARECTGSELTAQFEALAVEEALADVAEEIKAEGKERPQTCGFVEGTSGPSDWATRLNKSTGLVTVPPQVTVVRRHIAIGRCLGFWKLKPVRQSHGSMSILGTSSTKVVTAFCPRCRSRHRSDSSSSKLA